MRRALVALDQGTTSSRAVVFDICGRVLAMHTVPFDQIYPKPGWVEHNPSDILNSQIESLRTAVRKSGIPVEAIAAIGVANQRETALLWDRSTGEPVANAIVWQCRRTAPLVERLIADGAREIIRKKTGLIPDAYFSATKLAWLLDTYNLRGRAERGELCFGTVDTFLMWHMLEGRPHLTDCSNASRTMLFNITSLDWDDELLAMLNIPRALLPETRDTIGMFGTLDPSILGRGVPVTAVAGDQQAALFGQACFEPGMVKNTYGTGCFLLKNIGDRAVLSENRLLTSVAWRWRGRATYALEGSVFVAGAAVQWLRDELRIIERSEETETLARSIPDNQGVYFVPAFTGLGAPWWDMYGRGLIIGMTRGTGRAHFARAALESIAYQTADLLDAMERDDPSPRASLRVDGGASANGFLLQFQADILNAEIERPRVLETTALGAAWMAGLGAGVYESAAELSGLWQPDLAYRPTMEKSVRERNLDGWRRAVLRAGRWAEPQD
jgi:glycerol kinase